MAAGVVSNPEAEGHCHRTWPFVNSLATLYQDTGRYAEAEPLIKRAIAIGEKTLPPEHPDLMQVREQRHTSSPGSVVMPS
ncbi:MAG: tetratricopeptide repeat protein [Rhodospirillales bacterium]